MAVYIYGRQSGGDEDRSISVEQQISNCQHLAEEKNLKVGGVFQDLNTSGRLYWSGAENLAQLDFVYQKWIKETKKKRKYRAGLGELFGKLKNKDIIIVDDSTRLYRPLTNSFLESALVQFLLSKQVRLLTVKTGEVNLTSFNDNLINALQNRINDNQLAIQRQKSKDSISRLKLSGEHFPSIHRVFGYKWTGRKYEVEIDEEKAEIVRFIFSSFIGGASIISIAQTINERWKRIMRQSSVKDILNRALYCGYIEQKDGSLVLSQETKDKTIVDFNTWKLAREILDARKEHHARIKKRTHYFSGIIICGYCGGKMNSALFKNSKYPCYLCKTHHIIKKERCGCGISSETKYEMGLSLNECIEPLLIIGLLKKLNEKTDNGNVLEEKKIELNNLLSQEKKLSDLFLNGLIEEKTLHETLAKSKTRKKALQNEIIELENINNSDEYLRELRAKILNHKTTKEDYAELVQRSIKQIKVFKDKIEVNTVEGMIVLPRRIFSGMKVLPKYTWSNIEGKKLKLYYYYGDSFNIYAKRDLLFSSPSLEVYLKG